MPVLAPVRIIEELTRKEWGFGSPAIFGTNPAGPFMFNGMPWQPGVYIVVNASGATINAVLFGKSFTVVDGSRWRFMAHADLESFDWIGGAPPVAKPYHLPP